MITHKITIKKQDDKKDKCKAIYFKVVELSKLGEFEVIFQNIKTPKTNEQLKGVYKMFQLALPHFQKWRPRQEWDLEKIKEFVKAELGYTREPSGFEIGMMIKQSGFCPKGQAEKMRMIKFCKKIKQNISFADFTKEQLFKFINEFEVWALSVKDDKPSWNDVFLDDGSKKSLLEWYGKKSTN